MNDTLQILWLYDELLDLYGDGGNLKVLMHRLTEMGIPFQVKTAGLGEDADIENADFVYLGPGKPRNLEAALADIRRFAAGFKKRIACKKLTLCTGNALMLFGNYILFPDGRRTEGLGFFDFYSKEDGKVFIQDVIATSALLPENEWVYGFINRTGAIYESRAQSLHHVLRGCGNNVESMEEGIYENEFIGTWFLGPVLSKNPYLTEEILKKLTGDRFLPYNDTLDIKAYNQLMQDFHMFEQIRREEK